MKSALTVTVRKIDRLFVWWCNYHVSRFDYLFVWVDDPVGLGLGNALQSDTVRVELGSQVDYHLSEGWQGRTMVRQDINTLRALELCRAQGIDWLCHLDSDELLLGSRLQLESIWSSHHTQIYFPNHEVFPLWEASNPFTECKYFKLNGLYPFNYYRIGKAAVRVEAEVKAGGPHRFRIGDNFDAERIESVSVLHYASPTYELWLDKYLALGNFSNYWWDDVKFPIFMPFHLASRDCLSRCQRNGSLQEALRLWSGQVLPERTLQRLVSQGKAAVLHVDSHDSTFAISTAR